MLMMVVMDDDRDRDVVRSSEWQALQWGRSTHKSNLISMRGGVAVNQDRGNMTLT